MIYTILALKILAIAALITLLAMFPTKVGSDTVAWRGYETKFEIEVAPQKTNKIINNVVKGDCFKYADIIAKYDWPEDIAMAICSAESQGEPSAINWNDIHRDSDGNVICVSSRGLMQISCEWPKVLGYTLDDLVDPEKNIAMAYQIYLKNGFHPWTTYPGCLGIVN
jgi:soluble lytic murein transglycosylase-like protein